MKEEPRIRLEMFLPNMQMVVQQAIEQQVPEITEKLVKQVIADMLANPEQIVKRYAEKQVLDAMCGAIDKHAWLVVREHASEIQQMVRNHIETLLQEVKRD